MFVDWMNIYALKTFPFSTHVGDNGLPSFLSLSQCTILQLLYWMLMVLSFPSGELPSTEGCCLTWRVTSPTNRQPTAKDWLWLTPSLSSRGKHIYDSVYDAEPFHVHQAKAELPGTTLLFNFLFFFHSPFLPSLQI